MKRFLSFLTILVCLIAGSGLCRAAVNDIHLKLSSGVETRISKDEDGAWTWQAGAEMYTLAMEKAGLVFKRGQTILATGRIKGEDVTLTTASGGTFLGLKCRADKIKVVLNASSPPWEIKFKGNKVKIVHSGTEYGKVKFYSETGKIKAKDSQGNAVAEMKELSALSAAPGVFLIEPLTQDQAVFLALYILSAGK
nr:hypothetical protein [uncultured Desulfobacter sp.]